MSAIIRPMEERDRRRVMELMRAFYASEAVFTDGSDEIFANDIDACLSGTPFIEGYVFDDGGFIRGYAMLAKSFSTEFGRPCVWIEDIYIEESSRGMGLGSAFLSLVEAKYPRSLIRLEVEEENEHAVGLYRSRGFETLPYMEMIRRSKDL